MTTTTARARRRHYRGLAQRLRRGGTRRDAIAIKTSNKAGQYVALRSSPGGRRRVEPSF